MASNMYDKVTESIIRIIDDGGTLPWHKPWKSTPPQNPVTKTVYRGRNRLLLNAAPYKSSFWVTYNQARSLGGHVKAGERGWPIVWWSFILPNGVDPDDYEQPDDVPYIPMLKGFTVFNIEQCEGIEMPEGFEPVEHEPIDDAESIIAGYDGPVVIEAAQAWYKGGIDTVGLPGRERFESIEAYYSTAFHELGHSTGHSSRLRRKIGNGFGSKDYAFEELIAELTASFLCAEAGIDNQIGQSAAYMQHWMSNADWLEAFREDKSLFVRAAGQAVKAAEFILSRKLDAENENSSEDVA